MIDHPLSIQLPPPWTDGVFETNKIGPVNFLVGPNGSGKSQFAQSLLRVLKTGRLLDTDRLASMAHYSALRRFVSDTFSFGIQKNYFQHIIEAGKEGSGLDAFIILERNLQLRIRLEATLSHLFDRDIALEWDSGNLVPMASLREVGLKYRLDRDECHGIKELLVLLTHLYDDTHDYLIIDEPELNLHPQYQSFFMEEVHKVARGYLGGIENKCIFLITHSPFILDFRTEDDINSIISFNSSRSVPTQVSSINLSSLRNPLSLFRRLNAHHKQLFFSDNPIFVEGISDAQLIESMLAVRKSSIAGAGSCIIDVGGREEVSYYLRLCNGLGKKAHFIYDLDSLFTKTLRSYVADDDESQRFLIDAGLGGDFKKYFSDLDKILNEFIRQIISDTAMGAPQELTEYLKDLGDSRNWSREKRCQAKTAIITAVYRQEKEMEAVWEQGTKDVIGRMNKIVDIMGERRIYLLKEGALETYLPSYQGNLYKLDESSKRRAVQQEVEYLEETENGQTGLVSRYGGLYDVILSLPSKQAVDIEHTLKGYLAEYIHRVQQEVVKNPSWDGDRLERHLKSWRGGVAEMFSVRSFIRNGAADFTATVEIAPLGDGVQRTVQINNDTNAGMGEFSFVTAYKATRVPAHD